MGTGRSLTVTKETFRLPLILLSVFLSVAVWRWLATGRVFYLLNFAYIGLAIAIGIFLLGALPRKRKPVGRLVTQVLVGGYMLGYIGFVGRENMQLEGFFLYLFAGVFAGATLHYLIAKIAGPIVFGRGWCGYACWTAMVLDLLPFKRPHNGRRRGLGVFRSIHFLLSFALAVLAWRLLDPSVYRGAPAELSALIAGNILYYTLGIGLAFALRDNRAFCKYACPVPVLQKCTSGFSLMKVKIDADRCDECGVCETVCPMDIRITAYKREGTRVHSTECISCATCVYSCPKGALDISFAWDPRRREYIRYENPVRDGGKQQASDR